ncbi:MAG TPA: hypothetical protein VKB93_19550 [Thermoanaerobaculia bacterium]|nr:hypothetical protein [Thermoanaerobaculia bacterium]
MLLGIILGAILGALDGATAWFTPEVRTQMLGIIIGSTLKGVIAGIAAGWFARKVQNLWAGIVFGLVVGLVLAYAIVALGGGKYFFEIMLPGGLVGAILGFATQQYGRAPARTAAAALMAAFVMLFGVDVSAQEHQHAAPKSNAAFEKLKSLAGTWNANAMKPDGETASVEYRVTGAGSVVMETQFRGTDHEMITMYTVDGDDVMAKHYCSAGNQPLLKLNAEKSSPNRLVFDFVRKSGGAGPHINAADIHIADDGKVVEEWTLGTTKLRLYLQDRAK